VDIQEDVRQEVVEEDVEDDPNPFVTGEQNPTFNGGEANGFAKWVNSRLVYPEVAKENGVEGRVTLQFTIGKDGRLQDVKVLNSPDESLAQEAVRVVSSSPKWEPGRQRDRAVKVSYTFPVIYRLR
jgi:protein TonB